jgi:hypothetical protein
MADPSDPSGKPIFRLLGNVLTGAGGGAQIHSLTRPGIGDGTRPPSGRYQVLKPISHPLLGRIAVVVPLDEWLKTTAGYASVAPNFLSAISQPVTKEPIVLGKRYDIWSPPSPSGSASFSPHRGFVLTNDKVAAAQALAVLDGFDEMLDLLERSGGGTLEILG